MNTAHLTFLRQLSHIITSVKDLNNVQLAACIYSLVCCKIIPKTVHGF